jgi:hypothetical protein
MEVVMSVLIALVVLAFVGALVTGVGEHLNPFNAAGLLAIRFSRRVNDYRRRRSLAKLPPHIPPPPPGP